MKRATIHSRYPESMAHPIHRRLADANEVSRADLLMWGPMGTATTLAWYDGKPEAVANLLAPVESISVSDLVPGDDGTYAFVSQTEFELDPAVLEVLADSRVVFLPPVVFRDTGVVRFEAVGKPTCLSDFYAELCDVLECDIVRVRPFVRRASQAELTARQRAALEAAIDAGYYDVPRTGSIADVAAELECSRSTAGELVRKAESGVVTSSAELRDP
ncbi:helix-turn-helix domain-containing protein [Natrialba sp. SSL1]|uniref:helix-turn-helix domain-containing protein n=1 Tax=Natrialba sp. SSL1 TaxID=1869245 RepID=UPI0008F8060D|nr:helix-turn-helix domain-containing protein [Natrialba sp. SSL1]OIB56433.1 bacterio-opsin activator [Natrialba sp. SSL1]